MSLIEISYQFDRYQLEIRKASIDFESALIFEAKDLATILDLQPTNRRKRVSNKK